MIRMHPCEDDGASVRRRGMTAASDIDRLSQQREIEVERRALVGSALDANLARMLLDDAVSNRKAKTSAAFLAILGHVLGCKERIVNSLNVLLRNSLAAI